MIKKGVKALLKYGAVALLSASISYKTAGRIDYFANTIKFWNAANENGFLPKEQAFNLRISHERNSSSNLETYIESNGVKYEVFSRPDGIIAGDAYHNWENFTDEEKKKVLFVEVKNSSPEKLEEIFNKDSFSHVLSRMPQESRVDIIREYINSVPSSELKSIASGVDYEILWNSIPKEVKKEMLMKNLRASTRRSLDDIKNMAKDFFGGPYEVF